MAKPIEDEVAYYYDFHPTEEDLMGEAPVHAALIHYLISVLRWLFQEQRCAIYENFNFYQTSNSDEYPLAPDIAVIKGVDYREDIRSWRIGKTGPAPHVVFEIASSLMATGCASLTGKAPRVSHGTRHNLPGQRRWRRSCANWA